ncbi:alpha/beta hydrolase [Albimonas sp. CAU 1670]|uniref:alpha/beta hydrolase n=1 Tax=Albimonas sp. CAU 1670 TaxID=3032599 RepID=UPI0023DB188E|nr:alpha/beta hydrolase [Albimonas sp. CAU 1670]MDF2234506.1 alpha/beta hydrolase [Albimonas sp. CAU 1670]
MLQIDPTLFTDEAVSAETRAFIEKIEATLAEFPATNEVPVELTRKAREEGRGIFPSDGPLEGSEWREYPGGARRIRVSLPEGTPRGVYLHIHGGGWTLGSPAYNDGENQRVARTCGMAVISIEYRLAPEHPFPAAPDDCFAAAKWAIETLPFGDVPYFIGGESAGGHLSASTLLMLREAGLHKRIKGAVLTYGCYDMRMVASARNWGERKLILNTPVIEWFVANAIPSPADREDPIYSPILADLHDMPAALFSVGTEDPLMDDTMSMVGRWAGAGNRAELAVYPGGIHAFDAFPDLAIARGYAERKTAFLNGLLEA